MLKIYEDGTIELTRGDSAIISVAVLIDDSGDEYTILPEDRLTLSVKRDLRDTTYALQVSTLGSASLTIEPDDTRALECDTYYYDVQLDTADGGVYTLVPRPLAFTLVEEVTV